MPYPTLADLERRTVRTEEGHGCWTWIGATNWNGYSQISYRDDSGTVCSIRGHRLAYELHVGAVPAGLEIDHLCNNRRCVNPAHLEAVDHSENNRRAAERRVADRRSHENGDPYVPYCRCASCKSQRVVVRARP